MCVRGLHMPDNIGTVNTRILHPDRINGYFRWLEHARDSIVYFTKLSLRWSQVFSIPSTLQTDHKPAKVIPYPLRIYNIHIVCVFVLFVVAAYFVPKKCFTMSSEHPHIESNTAYRTARIMQLLYNLVIFCSADIVRLSFGIGGPVLQALCLCMVVPVISRRKLIQIKGFTRRVFGYHADN